MASGGRSTQILYLSKSTIPQCKNTSIKIILHHIINVSKEVVHWVRRRENGGTHGHSPEPDLGFIPMSTPLGCQDSPTVQPEGGGSRGP